jgi:hypothetical protein
LSFKSSGVKDVDSFKLSAAETRSSTTPKKCNIGSMAECMICLKPASPRGARSTAAVQGGDAVFSAQPRDVTGKYRECRHGSALVRAAWVEGVAQAGHHTCFPGCDSGRRSNNYWTEKMDIEEAVRNAGFAESSTVVSGYRAWHHLVLERSLALVGVA